MFASNFRKGTIRAGLPMLVLALILGAGADFPCAAQGGGTPSFCACIGEVSGSRELIDASCSGNIPEAKRLICQGADVNSAITAIHCPGDCPPQQEQINITALMIAAWRGDREIGEILLCRGADKNAVTHVGSGTFTAQDFAVMRGHDNVTGFIKDYSPRVKCPELRCDQLPEKAPPQKSPTGRHDVIICFNVTKCQESGSDHSFNNWVTDPVNTMGCREGYMACALCMGADPNAYTWSAAGHDLTALSKATWNCCTNQVKILLGENQYNTKPANVNYQDDVGHSALWWTADSCKESGECLETAKVLLKHGANVNATADGVSVLMRAVQRNCSKEFIKLLLDSGADPKMKDEDGKTALDYAKGNPEIEELLKQYRAKK